MRRKVLLIVLLTILLFIAFCLSGPVLVGEGLDEQTSRGTNEKFTEEGGRDAGGAGEAGNNNEETETEPMGIDVLVELSFSGYPEHISSWAARVAWCESRFDPKAYNSVSGATGLYQFISSTWSAYGEGDIWSPTNQIKAVKNMIDILGFETAKQHWECK